MECAIKEPNSDTFVTPMLRFEKPAPYKPCQFRSNETLKKTCWSSGLKGQSTLSCTLLKKGF